MHPAVRARGARRPAGRRRSRPCRSPRRPRQAGSTRSRPGRTAGSCRGPAFGLNTSRRYAAEHLRRLAVLAPGALHRSPRSRATSGRSRSQSQQTAVGVRARPHPRGPVGRAAPAPALGGRPVRRTAPPAGSCAARPPAGRRCSGWSRTPDSGTWCDRQVSSTGYVVHRMRTGPALRRPQYDHRPPRPSPARRSRRRSGLAAGSRRSARCTWSSVAASAWCTRRRVATLDQIRLVTVALAAAAVSSVVADPGEHRRVGDLVAVQMQDRQHRAVADRVEELVRVPRRRQRPGLGLAVADHAGDDQIRVVEGGAVRVATASTPARRPR